MLFEHAEIDTVVKADMTDALPEQDVLEFSYNSAEERAFSLIHGYFEAVELRLKEDEPVPEILTESFISWFNDPCDRKAKNRALDRLTELIKVKIEGYEIPGYSVK